MKFWKPAVATLSLAGATGLLMYGIVNLPGMFNHGAEPSGPPKVYTEIKVDPAVYEGYVGKYQLKPDTVMTVSKEVDRLFVQLTHRPKREIFPFSTTGYFLKDIQAEINFITDHKGRATALVLDQFGETRADRVK